MSKRYKSNQRYKRSSIRDKNGKLSKRIGEENKKRINNFKRRVKTKRREEMLDSRESLGQIDMIYDKNSLYEDENKSMNILISQEKMKMKENKIYLKKYSKINNKIQIKNIIIIIELFIIIINIIPRLPSIKLYLIKYNFSNITLKIKGTGNRKVLGYSSSYYYFDSQYYPNKVYINGELQNIVNYSYNFNQTYNFVELIWNNSINNCYYMFVDCPDIIEFDFSNFDTSQVINMGFILVHH